MRLSDDNSKADLAAVYAAAGTPEYAVINEDGVCSDGCHIRRLTTRIWLRVDDVDRNGNVVPA